MLSISLAHTRARALSVSFLPRARGQAPVVMSHAAEAVDTAGEGRADARIKRVILWLQMRNLDLCLVDSSRCQEL